MADKRSEDSACDQRGKVPAAKEGQSKAASCDLFRSRNKFPDKTAGFHFSRVGDGPTPPHTFRSVKLLKLVAADVKSCSFLLSSF